MNNYYINSSVGGGLVLSIDGSGFVVLDTQVAGNADQLWQFEEADQPNNFKIKHVGTGLYLLYTSNSVGRQLVLFSGDQGEDKNQRFYVWNTPNNQPFTDSSVVFRANMDLDQNLNAAGNSGYQPGTRVLTWGWSGGAPNETWYLEEYTGEPVSSTMERYVDVVKLFNAITPFVTNNASDSGCDASGLKVDCSEVTYSQSTITPTDQPAWTTTTTVTNSSDETSHLTAQVETKKAATYSYSVSNTIKTEISESMKIDCGFESDSISMKIDLSDTTTYSNSTEVDKVFSDSLDIEIPPHASRNCFVVLNGMEATREWTANARLYGTINASGYNSPSEMLNGDPRFLLSTGSKDAYTTIGGVTTYKGGHDFSWTIVPNSVESK